MLFNNIIYYSHVGLSYLLDLQYRNLEEPKNCDINYIVNEVLKI